MINKHYDQVDQILYVSIEGKVTVQELTALSGEILANDSYPRNLKLIEVAKADFSTSSPKEFLKTTAAFFSSAFSNFDTVRHAVISANPLVVAYVTLLQNDINNPKYSVSAFSTAAGAKEWMNQP